MSNWGDEVEDEPKSKHEKLYEKLVKANQCAKDNWHSVHEIKEALSAEDYGYAAQLWRELSDSERELLNIASTKGGIFTVKESKQMVSDEFKDAVRQMFEENK